MILSELNTAARDAGIKMGAAQFTPEPIVGSESLDKLSSNVGFEGNYANFTKFVNLIDKSPRFMIIENLQAAAPQQQGGQTLAVSLKIDTFVKNVPGVTP
jgi:Tfp pilus assembly protein PilO